MDANAILAGSPGLGRAIVLNRLTLDRTKDAIRRSCRKRGAYPGDEPVARRPASQHNRFLA